MMVNLKSRAFAEDKDKESYAKYLEKQCYEKLANLSKEQGAQLVDSIERLNTLKDAGLDMNERVGKMEDGPEKEMRYNKLGLYFHDLIIDEIKYLASILDMK